MRYAADSLPQGARQTPGRRAESRHVNSGDAGAIRVRWLVFLALVALGWQVGNQVAIGYYGVTEK